MSIPPAYPLLALSLITSPLNAQSPERAKQDAALQPIAVSAFQATTQPAKPLSGHELEAALDALLPGLGADDWRERDAHSEKLTALVESNMRPEMYALLEKRFASASDAEVRSRLDGALASVRTYKIWLTEKPGHSAQEVLIEIHVRNETSRNQWYRPTEGDALWVLSPRDNFRIPFEPLSAHFPGALILKPKQELVVLTFPLRPQDFSQTTVTFMYCIIDQSRTTDYNRRYWLIGRWKDGAFRLDDGRIGPSPSQFEFGPPLELAK